MPCRYNIQVSAYADGELHGHRADTVRGHITSCPECAALFQEIVRLKSVLAEQHRLAPNPGLTARTMARLQEKSIKTGFRPVLAPQALRWAFTACLVTVIAIGGRLALPPSGSQDPLITRCIERYEQLAGQPAPPGFDTSSSPWGAVLGGESP